MQNADSQYQHRKRTLQNEEQLVKVLYLQDNGSSKKEKTPMDMGGMGLEDIRKLETAKRLAELRERMKDTRTNIAWKRKIEAKRAAQPPPFTRVHMGMRHSEPLAVDPDAFDGGPGPRARGSDGPKPTMVDNELRAAKTRLVQRQGYPTVDDVRHEVLTHQREANELQKKIRLQRAKRLQHEKNIAALKELLSKNLDHGRCVIWQSTEDTSLPGQLKRCEDRRSKVVPYSCIPGMDKYVPTATKNLGEKIDTAAAIRRIEAGVGNISDWRELLLSDGSKVVVEPTMAPESPHKKIDPQTGKPYVLAVEPTPAVVGVREGGDVPAAAGAEAGGGGGWGVTSAAAPSTVAAPTVISPRTASAATTAAYATPVPAYGVAVAAQVLSAPGAMMPAQPAPVPAVLVGAPSSTSTAAPSAPVTAMPPLVQQSGATQSANSYLTALLAGSSTITPADEARKAVSTIGAGVASAASPTAAATTGPGAAVSVAPNPVIDINMRLDDFASSPLLAAAAAPTGTVPAPGPGDYYRTGAAAAASTLGIGSAGTASSTAGSVPPSATPFFGHAVFSQSGPGGADVLSPMSQMARPR